jgi:hypothetical protein
MNMNFNNLCKTILEEFEAVVETWGGKFAFDGKREVYVANIYVHDYCDSKDIKDLQYYDIHRMKDDQVEYWDTVTGREYDMYIEKYPTLDQALQGLVKGYLNDSESHNWVDAKGAQAVVEKLRGMFEKYKDVPAAEWGFAAFGEHDILEFGFEVDINYLRSIQINKGMEDVDTSGFEDLL